MPLCVANRSIQRVSIVDDEEAARESCRYNIEDLKLEPVLETQPLHDMDLFLKELPQRADAVLCDYHLRTKNYARFDGDEIVARCYQMKFPAVLCTTFTDVDVTLMRSRRRCIPVLLTPNTLNPESIALGLECCIQEFDGQFQATREPSRTLVRVDSVEMKDRYFYVIIPGWNPRKKIRLVYEDLPNEMHALIEPGKRFHACVNVGAETHEELYLDSWEAE